MGELESQLGEMEDREEALKLSKKLRIPLDFDEQKLSDESLETVQKGLSY